MRVATKAANEVGGAVRPASIPHPEETLGDVLRQRAVATPDDVAYVFLVDGEHEEERLSYAELDRRARRIAVALAAGGREAPVLLLFDPGLDFIAALFGCFLAGVIAVPVYPPDPRDLASGRARLRRVAADAGVRTVLTTDAVRAHLDRRHAFSDALDLDWRTVDGLAHGTEALWRPSGVASDAVAFLQYTSGSTGTPKGVMVTHANILAHGAGVIATLALDEQSVVVSWLPVYHDMGLIGTLLIPMQAGCRSIQMSPLAFLERPRRWLQAIARYGGTLSPAPNFAYDLVVRKTTPSERAALDLGTWRVALNGAEPVRAETCERFLAAFGPSGFRRTSFVPCYGLAEATLMVAGGPADAGPVTMVVDSPALDAHRVVRSRHGAAAARTLVASGDVVAGLDVAIVHPKSRAVCADNEVGEIWIAGATVTAGYWRRPEDTAAVFAARLADGRGPFLRTGDLGFVCARALFVTGRCKDLIVIRGRNYYPHDLEHTAAVAHSALRPGGGAAFSVDDGRGEQLVVVHEIEGDDRATCVAAAAAIREAIALAFAVHVQAVVLIPPRTLPKTSSGKVRRRACRAQLAAGNLHVVHAWPDERGPAVEATTIEAWLVHAVAAVRDLPEGTVDRDAALVALGIDSAEAAQVAAEIELRLGRPVPLRLFLEQPTIATLASALLAVVA